MKGGKMRKILCTILLLIVVTFNSLSYALTLADLEASVKDDVVFVIEENLDDEIEYITIEELEGTEFEVLDFNEDYVIVEVDGEIFIIEKE